MEGTGFTLPPRSFGPPGTTDYEDIIVPNRIFDFRLFLYEGGQQIAVDLQGIGNDDILVITAILQNTFVGSFFHQTAGVVGTCTVICPDGTKGQGCLICRDPPLVVRICC